MHSKTDFFCSEKLPPYIDSDSVDNDKMQDCNKKFSALPAEHYLDNLQQSSNPFYKDLVQKKMCNKEQFTGGKPIKRSFRIKPSTKRVVICVFCKEFQNKTVTISYNSVKKGKKAFKDHIKKDHNPLLCEILFPNDQLPDLPDPLCMQNTEPTIELGNGAIVSLLQNHKKRKRSLNNRPIILKYIFDKEASHRMETNISFPTQSPEILIQNHIISSDIIEQKEQHDTVTIDCFHCPSDFKRVTTFTSHSQKNTMDQYKDHIRAHHSHLICNELV